MRASRLGLTEAPLGLVAETCVERILATIEQAGAPDFMVVDLSSRFGPKRSSPLPAR